MRIFLDTARLVVAVVWSTPALNDLPGRFPELAGKVYRLMGLRDVDVHEWLCDVGLCPCGIDLDLGDIVEAAGELAAAV